MIELHDPRREMLSHAYGSAADTPELLRQLAVCRLVHANNRALHRWMSTLL